VSDRAALIVRLGAVCFGALGPTGAEARPSTFTVDLEYDAVPGCPDVTEFKAVVATRLGRVPFSDSAPDHVLARITARTHALDGRLEWRDGKARWTGEQTFPLVTTDCVHLTRVMGFALSVQIQLLESTRARSEPDGSTAADEQPATAPPTDHSFDRRVATLSPTPPAPKEAPAAPVVVSPPPSPRHRAGPELVLGAGPSLGLGMASRPLLLGRVFGALLWPRVSIELAAEASRPATTRRADGSGFFQQQTLLGLAGCTISRWWRVCLIAKAGAVRMAGEDVDITTSAIVPVIAAGARVGVVQRFGQRLFLSAHVDGLTVLGRWTATLDHVPVWTAPRFAGALGLDAEMRFR
jgi:hypothetical protein